MKKTVLIMTGVFLVFFSLFGAIYASRVAVAQWVYFKFRYGSESKAPLDDITAKCLDAFAMYPHNYYFSIVVAERNYYERADAEGPGEDARLAKSELWCDRGLAQNFHKSQLRLLKTRILARHSIDEAILFWRDYVEWQFWEPYNHAVLAEMYLERGDFAEASKSLQWVKGTVHYPESVRKFNEAWEREMKLPDLNHLMN